MQPHNLLLVNERASVSVKPLFDGSVYLVVDDFLAHPQELREFAIQHAREFYMEPHNANPGLEYKLPREAFFREFYPWWRRSVAARFGALRSGIIGYARLSNICVPPHLLQPRQMICHQDGKILNDRDMAQASVCYLFDDVRLGGTAFYRAKVPDPRLLVELVKQVDQLALGEQYPYFRGPPRYMTESNELFELVDVVEPRFNRAVFYQSLVFHSAHILRPDLLSEDPALGRLTLNIFLKAYGS